MGWWDGTCPSLPLRSLPSIPVIVKNLTWPRWDFDNRHRSVPLSSDFHAHLHSKKLLFRARAAQVSRTACLERTRLFVFFRPSGPRNVIPWRGAAHSAFELPMTGAGGQVSPHVLS